MDDLIGDDNGCTTREGRLYLKDIGITEGFISDILTSADASTADFMANRRRHATQAVSQRVVSHLGKFTLGKTFIDRTRVGKYPEDEELLTGDATYAQGMVIEVCTPATNTRLGITKLEWYGETTGPVVVTFHDLRDGTVITTETLTAVAGQVTTLDVDITIQCFRDKKRILVTTDQDIYYRSNATYSGCSTCKGGADSRIFKVKAARILNSDKKINANVLPAQDMGGLSLIATLECDTLGFICEGKASMALPLLYFLGWDIFTMALNNYQRWGIQNIRRESIETRKNELEGLFNSAMDDLYTNMVPPNDGLCFVCNDRITSAIRLPG